MTTDPVATSDIADRVAHTEVFDRGEIHADWDSDGTAVGKLEPEGEHIEEYSISGNSISSEPSGSIDDRDILEGKVSEAGMDIGHISEDSENGKHGPDELDNDLCDDHGITDAGSNSSKVGSTGFCTAVNNEVGSNDQGLDSFELLGIDGKYSFETIGSNDQGLDKNNLLKLDGSTNNSNLKQKK